MAIFFADFDLSMYFPAATKFIANALADNENARIYIHCVQVIMSCS